MRSAIIWWLFAREMSAKTCKADGLAWRWLGLQEFMIA